MFDLTSFFTWLIGLFLNVFFSGGFDLSSLFSF